MTYDYHVYTLDSESQLDTFDDGEAYALHGEKWCVLIIDKMYYPVFCRRQNGDADGIEGYNHDS